MHAERRFGARDVGHGEERLVSVLPQLEGDRNEVLGMTVVRAEFPGEEKARHGLEIS
jgi:hypothetical protein